MCLPKDSASLADRVVPIAVVLSVVGAMLVAVAALLVWFRLAVQIKTKWQREQELTKHRQLGVPSSGLATIVVTDIEQYSGTTRWVGRSAPGSVHEASVGCPYSAIGYDKFHGNSAWHFICYQATVRNAWAGRHPWQGFWLLLLAQSSIQSQRGMVTLLSCRADTVEWPCCC